MKVTLKLNRNLSLTAVDTEGRITKFDSPETTGGDGSASCPMTIMLEAVAACAMMDTAAILRKKRKEIDDFQIEAIGIRANEHPKVFESVHLHFILTSSDSQIEDLRRSIGLSMEKYCPASAMFKRAGCKVTWDSEIRKPNVEAEFFALPTLM